MLHIVKPLNLSYNIVNLKQCFNSFIWHTNNNGYRLTDNDKTGYEGDFDAVFHYY
jgi:hypothetical protein